MQSQFIEVVKKFLINLGYPADCLIRPVSGATQEQSQDEYLPDILVVDGQSRDVLAIVVLAESCSASQVESVGRLLQGYANANSMAVEQFIIALSKASAKNKSPIDFYSLEHQLQSFEKIDFTEFPAYPDLLVNHHLSRAKSCRSVAEKARQSLINYAVVFATLFIFIVIGDIYLDRVLDMSYLNVQRSVLIAAAALILLIPQLFPKSCDSQSSDD